MVSNFFFTRYRLYRPFFYQTRLKLNVSPIQLKFTSEILIYANEDNSGLQTDNDSHYEVHASSSL